MFNHSNKNFNLKFKQLLNQLQYFILHGVFYFFYKKLLTFLDLTAYKHSTYLNRFENDEEVDAVFRYVFFVFPH